MHIFWRISISHHISITYKVLNSPRVFYRGYNLNTENKENNNDDNRIRQEKLDPKQKEIVKNLDNVSLEETKES